MSYATQARMSEDIDVINRVAACAAAEGVEKPVGWVSPRSWLFAAQPGWDAAYASAIATGDERPGLNEGAITDSMILAAVQTVIAAEIEPVPEPDPSPAE